MSSRYLNPPESKDISSFEALVANSREELQDAARSAADAVSSRLKVGDYNGASEYLFDMVVQSMMINLREPPRK
ncbi:MAG: hypothetical protein QXO71_05325, partial [Candidatus Jordarchaeaceae archaeon]